MEALDCGGKLEKVSREAWRERIAENTELVGEIHPLREAEEGG